MPPTIPDLGGRSSEPLMIVGVVVALVSAGMTLLVQFGIDLTDGQQAAVVGVVTALAALVTAVWGRSKVFSPATVATLLAAHGGAEVAARADDTTVSTVVTDPRTIRFRPGSGADG